MSPPKLVTWDYNTGNEAETFFLALAARHAGGQQQNPVDSANVEDDDSEEDSGSCEERTDIQGTPSMVADEVIKRKRFLDSFAELLARKKEGNFVSCAALAEENQRATIYVARNNGFTPHDEIFFTMFIACAKDIHQECTKRKTKNLLEMFLDYYKARVRYHTNELVRNFPENSSGTANLLWNRDPLLKEYKSLVKACRTAQRQHVMREFTNDVSRNLSSWAYGLSRSAGLKAALGTVCDSMDAERNIRRLRFLARIQSIHSIVSDCIKTLPSFGSLQIIPIQLSQAVAPTTVKISTARKLASKAMHQASLTPFTRLEDPKITTELSDEFTKKLVVHAEIQVCFHLLCYDVPSFPYLGISKKTCYMCHLFLTELKVFESRPSHGQLHPHWTLPRLARVDERQMFALLKAHRAVKQGLAEIISNPPSPAAFFRPESTTVWSSRAASVANQALSAISAVISTSSNVNHTHRIQDSSTRELDAVQLPVLSLTTSADEVEDTASIHPLDLDNSEDLDSMRTQLNAIKEILHIHYEELPDAVQEKLASLDFGE